MNSIYLRRKTKIVLERGAAFQHEPVVAALLKNLEAFGYTLSQELINIAQTLSTDQLEALYKTLATDLQKMLGAHHEFKPMYPNFPQQVMKMSEGELYFNAIIHYLTGLRPFTVKKGRGKSEGVKPKIIGLGNVAEFEAIFTQICASKTSISAQDREDLAWFVAHYGEDVAPLLPPEMPSKENRAIVGALLLGAKLPVAAEFLRVNFTTATDILRLAVALSDGDVSLATPSKFGPLSRPMRRQIVALMENCGALEEDLRRHKMRWIRLAERLHIGEFADKFPRAFAAINTLRNGNIETFAGRVQRQVEQSDVGGALELLSARPGELARRLDHLLRLDSSRADETLDAFEKAAAKVATPVLLQVKAHFEHRNDGATLRTFFPKGQIAKVQAIENQLPALDAAICARVGAICEATLVERFAQLPALGACYLAPEMENYLVPFSQRSAAKALRTLVRGSKLALPDADTLRFFLWWKNGYERTDLDLSAAFFDMEWQYVDVVSYYNLKNFGGHHSGDIVDAPDGAAEFIDVSRARLAEKKVRYVVMNVMSYTAQPFCDLPECFAGWMPRTKPNSGEIFEPKTVADRIDIASDTRICLPAVFDLHKNEAVWLDIALKNQPTFNNVENNLSGVSLMARALTDLPKTTLHELFSLHVRARGESVDSMEATQTIFAVDQGITPFDLAEIGANWLCKIHAIELRNFGGRYGQRATPVFAAQAATFLLGLPTLWRRAVAFWPGDGGFRIFRGRHSPTLWRHLSGSGSVADYAAGSQRRAEQNADYAGANHADAIVRRVRDFQSVPPCADKRCNQPSKMPNCGCCFSARPRIIW